MNQMNDRAEARQIKRLFAGGIAAADHHERLVAENRQRAVARRAIGHALGFQQILARARPDAGGSAPVAIMTVSASTFSPSTVSANGLLEKSAASTDAETGLGAKTFRLFLHPRHQFIAIHAFGKAGKIFNDAGGGEQTAGLFAGEHERLEVGARGIKRRRPARATRTDDNDFFHRGRNIVCRCLSCKFAGGLVAS